MGGTSGPSRRPPGQGCGAARHGEKRARQEAIGSDRMMEEGNGSYYVSLYTEFQRGCGHVILFTEGGPNSVERAYII